MEKDKQEISAYIEHDENEEIVCMMTGTECEDLKKFMEAKSTFEGRNFCERCTKRSCKECDLLKKKFSLQEKQAFKEIWDKVTFVKTNGKLRVRSEYTYQNDPQETLLKRFQE